MMKIALVFFAGLLATFLSQAAALVQTVSGDVRVERNGIMSGVQLNQRIEAGSTIYTTAGGIAVLRFDDGQIAAISEKSTLRIDGYRFDNARPELDRIAVSIFSGATRFITGLIGSRSRSAFALKTTTSTVGIRGTDFVVGVQGGDYLSVTQGSISGTNLAGSVNFAAGTTAFIASPTVLPAAIAASTIPTGIAAAFTQLGNLSVGTTVGAVSGSSAAGGAGAASGSGAAAGAQIAGSSALGSLGLGSVAAGAAVVGAIAASSASTGTTGTK